jgi:hypothetical protein
MKQDTPAESCPPKPRTSDLKSLLKSSHNAAVSENPRKILNRLGFKNKLVCMGPELWNCTTRNLSQFRDPLTEHGVIVPAVMSAIWGRKANSSGRSPRTNDNTGPELFLVYARKSGSLDEQASNIRHLQQRARLVMIVRRDPGHIEAWFSATKLTAQQKQEFRDQASDLGAPNEVYSPCTAYALPNGWNHQRKCRQEVIYWNPCAL